MTKKECLKQITEMFAEARVYLNEIVKKNK